MKMKTGMLWFDDTSKRSFDVKLERAIQHYRKKRGRAPNVCYVHPSCLPSNVPSNGIEVLTAKDILPHHFWLGIGERQEAED
ncbi:MAG: hypothetical protein U9R48_01100 [Chloroflexota bacterium]|nr:hypothetical protein [Chloroflexota bacterium]